MSRITDSFESHLSRTLAEHLPALVSYLDSDLCYRYANRRHERFLNRPAAEIIGRNIAELIGPESFAVAKPYLDAALRGENADHDAELAAADGSRAMHVTYVPDVREGAVLGIFVLAWDITEQRRTEKALKMSDERLRAIVDTAVDAIITIDRDGLIKSFNRAAERMFGYAAAEVIGRNVSTLMPPPYCHEHDEYISRYLRTGDAQIIGIGREVTAQRRDGSIFPIDLAVSEVDHLQIFTGIIRDISHRKQTEERLRQADRMSSIGTLAAGLGHDMTNVLLPVRSRLDLIERSGLTPAIGEHFVEIRKSIRYLQDLADGLHMLTLNPESLDSAETTCLEEWWEHVRSLLKRALPKHVQFAASMSSGLPDIGVAPHRLTQAVLNLIVNSSDAVGADGRVSLAAEAGEDGTLVRLSVSDNGRGMTEDVRRRAIEPFFTTKTRGLGTGLGLSLVHGVVQQAGGTIDIQSAPGQGTTITLNFPAATAEKLSGRTDPVEPLPPRAQVVIEDNRVASLVRDMLEMSGFDVERDGVSTHDLALVVTDDASLDSPRRRGVAERARQVIILGDKPTCSTASKTSVIVDPNDFDALRNAINRAGSGE